MTKKIYLLFTILPSRNYLVVLLLELLPIFPRPAGSKNQNHVIGICSRYDKHDTHASNLTSLLEISDIWYDKQI